MERVKYQDPTDRVENASITDLKIHFTVSSSASGLLSILRWSKPKNKIFGSSVLPSWMQIDEPSSFFPAKSTEIQCWTRQSNGSLQRSLVNTTENVKKKAFKCHVQYSRDNQTFAEDSKSRISTPLGIGVDGQIQFLPDRNAGALKLLGGGASVAPQPENPPIPWFSLQKQGNPTP